MDEIHMKKLFSTLKCGVCGQRYQTQHLHVLGHRDELWFLNVHCVACGSHGIVAAVIKESRAHQVVSELSPMEQERFYKAKPIADGDILDIHAFLKDFDGDFKRLFPQK